jgi:hypothetical protein
MKQQIFNKKDFYTGLIFIFFGIIAILEARHYVMGNAARMGPSYFPSIIGIILVLLGLIISVRPLWLSGNANERIVLGPLLLVTFAVLTFTVLIESLGLVLATLPLIVISSFGHVEFNLRKVIVLYLVLVASAVCVFVYLLKIPFRVWPW